MKTHFKCQGFGCRKNKAPHNKYCWSCIKERYAKKNPEKYAYQVLRNNAKRRGIKFTITYTDFLVFCIKTKILLGRGRTKECLSIDRIDNNKGYETGNLQTLTVSENSRKRTLKFDWERGYFKVVIDGEDTTVYPF